MAALSMQHGANAVMPGGHAAFSLRPDVQPLRVRHVAVPPEFARGKCRLRLAAFATSFSMGSIAVRASRRHVLALRRRTFATQTSGSVSLQRRALSSRAVTATSLQQWGELSFERYTSHNLGEDTLDKAHGLTRLLYLPGLDGDGAYTADFEFEGLAKSYDVWRLRIGPQDRSIFTKLEAAVCDFLMKGPQHVTLVGESFGGMLALAVAERMERQGSFAGRSQGIIQGVIVLNSGTSFRLAKKESKGTAAALISAAQLLDGTAYTLAAGSALPLSCSDARTVLGSMSRVLRSPSEAPEFMASTLDLISKFSSLPRKTFFFRVDQWLDEGCRVMSDSRLKNLDLPVLLVSGGQDALLPSVAEARRLASLLPNAEVKVLPFSGHAMFIPYGNDLDKLAGNAPTPSLRQLVEGASWNMGRRASEAALARDNPAIDAFLQQEGASVSFGPVDFIPFIGTAGTSNAKVTSKKRLLVFLPGIAGSGAASAAAQFPNLSDDFQCFRCEIRQASPSFAALADAIAQGISAKAFCITAGNDTSEREVLLLGESFGGVLALAVATRLQECDTCNCRGVVVVNPATAYGDSDAAELGPLIEAVPDAAFPGLLRSYFLATSMEPYQWRQMLQRVVQAEAPEGSIQFGAGQPLANLARYLGRILTPADDGLGLTKADLKQRLEFMRQGNLEVGLQLQNLSCPVLAVCGAEDRLQPSREEAHRLEKSLPDCVAIVLQGRGHALLADGRLNLAQLIRLSPRLRTAAASPLAIAPPTPAMFREASEMTDNFEAAVAPVWLSTDPDGNRIVAGLNPLRKLLQPTSGKRPIVFVGYHQRYSIDVGLILSKFYREFGVLLRGLTHPEILKDPVMQDVGTQFLKWIDIGLRGDEAMFQSPMPRSQSDKRDPAESEKQVLEDTSNNIFTKFGAVPVSARNFVRLLQEGENILLFPGGVREAFHGKGDEYKLFWPPEPEFVRAAARYGATIVPFAAVGAAETIPLLLDQNELDRVPVIGENLRQVQGKRSRVRDGESFSPPLGMPIPPERFYFLFGKPVDLHCVESRDRAQCAEVYGKVRSEVEHAIANLLEWRRDDPYRKALPRWMFQASNSGQEPPTFNLP